MESKSILRSGISTAIAILIEFINVWITFFQSWISFDSFILLTAGIAVALLLLYLIFFILENRDLKKLLAVPVNTISYLEKIVSEPETVHFEEIELFNYARVLSHGLSPGDKVEVIAYSKEHFGLVIMDHPNFLLSQSQTAFAGEYFYNNDCLIGLFKTQFIYDGPANQGCIFKFQPSIGQIIPQSINEIEIIYAKNGKKKTINVNDLSKEIEKEKKGKPSEFFIIIRIIN